MGLKILRNGRTGLLRGTWYARTMGGGRRMETNLGVPVRGSVPLDGEGHVNLRGRGDEEFEASRAEALRALEELQRRLARKEAPGEIARRYYRLRTGESLGSPRLDDLFGLWTGLKRTYVPTEERLRNTRIAFRRFAEFARSRARARGASCDTLDEVTPSIASEFFDELRSKYAWGTVKDQMHLLSGAWARWHVHAEKNPFSGIVMRSRELEDAAVHRRPLTQEELAELFEATSGDRSVHELVVCAACTGMRLGDVCNLVWADVDLSAGLIDVATAKTGRRVTIPVFTPLRRVLEARLAERPDGEAFVFPEAARRYNHRSAKGTHSLRTGLVRCVKPYMARAVFGGEPQPVDAVPAGEADAAMDIDAVVRAIEAARFAPGKRERLLATARMRASGASYSEIAMVTGKQKSVVSEDLREIGAAAGLNLRPGWTRAPGGPKSALVEKTRQERKRGMYAASILGWHTLRATFVVIAVEAGVPLPDIQKIVGHGTVETTLNYYNPTGRHTAERVRQMMRGTVLETAAPRGGAIRQPPPPAPLPQSAIGAFVDALSEEQRKDLARRLLGL